MFADLGLSSRLCDSAAHVLFSFTCIHDVMKSSPKADGHMFLAHVFVEIS